MAKNNKLINQYKYMYKQTQEITPAIYASFALALYRRGWRYKRINDLFMETQDIWKENSGSLTDFLKEVYEQTGIELRNGE